MTEIQRLEQLEDIIAHIVIDEPRIQRPEIGIVDILEDQRRCLALAVPHHIQQSHDIGPAREVLQDLDFALYLLLLDGFQDLDDAFLVVDDVDALEDLRVLSSPCSLVSPCSS